MCYCVGRGPGWGAERETRWVGEGGVCIGVRRGRVVGTWIYSQIIVAELPKEKVGFEMFKKKAILKGCLASKLCSPVHVLVEAVPDQPNHSAS